MYSLFWYYFKCRGVRRISCLTFCEFRENDSTKEKEKAILQSLTPNRKSENISRPFKVFLQEDWSRWCVVTTQEQCLVCRRTENFSETH